MKRFAVNFVILPPAPVVDVAVSLNKRLCDDSYIALDKDHCLPHISLLMGCLRRDQIEHAQSLLEFIGSDHKAMKLDVSRSLTVNTSSGDVITLDIAPNANLRALHESLVNAFASLLSTDAAEADVLGESNNSTLDWINNYFTQSSFDKFWPHITLGYLKPGVIPEQIEPFSFMASRLAICHLGNYCTCKRILNETSLTG